MSTEKIFISRSLFLKRLDSDITQYLRISQRVVWFQNAYLVNFAPHSDGDSCNDQWEGIRHHMEWIGHQSQTVGEMTNHQLHYTEHHYRH